MQQTNSILFTFLSNFHKEQSAHRKDGFTQNSSSLQQQQFPNQVTQNQTQPFNPISTYSASLNKNSSSSSSTSLGMEMQKTAGDADAQMQTSPARNMLMSDRSNSISHSPTALSSQSSSPSSYHGTSRFSPQSAASSSHSLIVANAKNYVENKNFRKQNYNRYHQQTSSSPISLQSIFSDLFDQQNDRQSTPSKNSYSQATQPRISRPSSSYQSQSGYHRMSSIPDMPKNSNLSAQSKRSSSSFHNPSLPSVVAKSVSSPDANKSSLIFVKQPTRLSTSPNDVFLSHNIANPPSQPQPQPHPQSQSQGLTQPFVDRNQQKTESTLSSSPISIPAVSPLTESSHQSSPPKMLLASSQPSTSSEFPSVHSTAQLINEAVRQIRSQPSAPSYTASLPFATS